MVIHQKLGIHASRIIYSSMGTRIVLELMKKKKRIGRCMQSGQIRSNNDKQYK
jgi:hypothetical protein